MTPEERFTRIENFLNAMVEHQAKFNEDLRAQAKQHAREIAEIRETQARDHAGVRDLILVSGTLLESQRNLLESQKETTAQINELREGQRATDEKLNVLISTVDRIIRNKQN